MEIKNYKTKFNLEDVVWFMYDNKPSQGIIHRIKYTQEEAVDTRCRHKDIFHKIKSFLSGKYVERIPLTKEFFEKNGFIKQNDWDEVLYYRSEDMRIEAYENYLGWVVNIDDENCTMVFSNNLKYVHKLQNAYYVSTGEEMEIRL